MIYDLYVRTELSFNQNENSTEQLDQSVIHLFEKDPSKQKIIINFLNHSRDIKNKSESILQKIDLNGSQLDLSIIEDANDPIEQKFNQVKSFDHINEIRPA